jgi:hypothetical protein
MGEGHQVRRHQGAVTTGIKSQKRITPTGFACEVSAASNKLTGRRGSEYDRSLLTRQSRKEPWTAKTELLVAFRREQSEASALDEVRE